MEETTKPKVLCIEDEHFIGELYTRALTNAGYNVWPIINAPANGILIVTVIMEDGTKISKKFLSVK